MDNPNEIAKLGVEFARDLVQQLITLATGILALTITFTKDVLKEAPLGPMWALKLAWVIYLLSICFGIWAMMALTGMLAPSGFTNVEPTLSIGWRVRLPSSLQILSFVVGVALTIVYGAISLRRYSRPVARKDQEMESNS